MGFGLGARLLAIAASAMLALWLAFIAFFYWTSDLSRTGSLLPPAQLLAIVDLVDRTPNTERNRVLEAVQSSMLDVATVPRSTPLPAGQDVAGEADFSAYHALLGDRLEAIRRHDQADNGKRPRLLRHTARPLTFGVYLKDGTVLRAQARTPFVVTLYGLPAGMGAGLLGTLFALIAFFLLHREIRPLRKLAAAVDAIDPSGQPVKLPVLHTTAPEIRALVRAFERLQNRLHIMTRSRMALIGGIQHDVRSFATRLRLRLERLPDPDERDRATADITDMINLLDNALLTSRAGVGALQEEMLDLGELIGSEIADFRHSALPVEFAPDPDLGETWMIGDRVALRRILGNVIDNAVKYGQRAHVSFSASRVALTIAVEDDGPGFRPEDAELLLEPFVRAEPSRARATGGAGLGLAVTRTLVEAQGGEISLDNGPRGGRVRLVFPRFNPV